MPLAFLGTGVGASEILLVFVVALLLLGPRELPRLARTAGRLAARLRSVSRDFRDQFMQIDDDNPSAAIPNPSNREPSDDLAG